jgi:alpha/beta superfamily hydrolase
MSRQRVVKFGTVAPLTGILTEPDNGAARESTAVIILNSGILHHVGANRLHVQLARRLADLGFASLRFDFSGIGDSEARRDNLSFEQSAPRETQDAIDYLAKSHGLESVVLTGLCSGADVAHLTAVADSRVVGLGLLDPWAYRTRAYYIHYYLQRVTRPGVYVNWIRVRAERLRRRFSGNVGEGGRDPDMYEMPQYLREFPPRERVARDLADFMRRKIELFFLFSGGLEEYNHRGQYRASLPEVDFGGRLREGHIPQATHVFSALEHQRAVIGNVSDWVRERFGGRPSANGAR